MMINLVLSTWEEVEEMGGCRYTFQCFNEFLINPAENVTSTEVKLSASSSDNSLMFAVTLEFIFLTLFRKKHKKYVQVCGTHRKVEASWTAQWVLPGERRKCFRSDKLITLSQCHWRIRRRIQGKAEAKRCSRPDPGDSRGPRGGLHGGGAGGRDGVGGGQGHRLREGHHQDNLQGESANFSGLL